MRLALQLAMVPPPDERVAARPYHSPSTVRCDYSIACAPDIPPVRLTRLWAGYLTDGWKV